MERLIGREKISGCSESVVDGFSRRNLIMIHFSNRLCFVKDVLGKSVTHFARGNH